MSRFASSLRLPVSDETYFGKGNFMVGSPIIPGDPPVLMMMLACPRTALPDRLGLEVQRWHEE
jgi:hypothetical protein